MAGFLSNQQVQKHPMAYTLGGMGALGGLGGLAYSGLLGKGAGNFLTGTPGRVQQSPTMTQGQMGAQNQALQMAMQGLQNPYSGFDPIQQQEMQRFQQQTIPGLAERFTSMGEGGQRSSAFQGALGGASADLGSQLAALRSQYGLQQQGQMQNLLGMGLRPQFESIYQPGSQGVMGQALGGLSSMLPLLAFL